MNVKVVQGDILTFEGDAIVNPANSFLRHGAGLAKIIADAATAFPPGLHAGDMVRDQTAWHAEQRRHPLVPTGGAGWTTAGTLPYKGIVHAVGPIWGGGFFEGALLSLVHYSAIRCAADHDCKSLAIPAISCGLFGFPVEAAASVAVTAAQDASAARGVDVTFYLFEDAHYDAYQAALKGSW